MVRDGDTVTLQPYKVMVSLRFIFLTTISSVLASFAVGQFSHYLLMVRHAERLAIADYGIVRTKSTLPPPITKDGKDVPHTIYTAKNFDTARAASSSLLIRRDEDSTQSEESSCDSHSETCADKPVSIIDQDEEHLPAGQHLLVDMKHLSFSFLNSEERLARAMVEVVNQASLTLLSYHCHTLVPSGVSCVGVLLESHVSFHTWPEAGVITLDLFTCGSNSLLPVVPIIERLFGVPADNNKKPFIIWSHKLRGFRKERGPLQTWDLGFSVLNDMNMEYKKEIVSVTTKFQRVDIYDKIDPRFNSLDNYQKSLSSDNPYYAENKECFAPDRSLFLDGILQSTGKGERAYHEALVHPALFIHPNPTRVGIVGGGEGATLREVLKHKTVEEAIMIEIDEQLVSLCRQYLPSWNDCSDIEGSTPWCGNDKRANIFYEDALAWFIERYHDQTKIAHETFDVIIMDALDPQDDVEFCEILYNNQMYLTSLYNALSDDGIFVVQVGNTPAFYDPAEDLGLHSNRAKMIDLLESIGFSSINIYGHGHSGFGATWNNIIATKSWKIRKNWFRSEAEINVEIHKRIIKTKSGIPSLRYFDGATMQLFQFPSKRFENVFCKRNPLPPLCIDSRGFDPEIKNVETSLLEVKESLLGSQAGRGLFAKQDMPKGTYVGIESSVHWVYFPPSTFELMTKMEALSDEIAPIEIYAHGYGYQSTFHGAKEVVVDSTIVTFANHACNGQNNIGIDAGNFNEFTVDPLRMPSFFKNMGLQRSAYNPVMERNIRVIMVSGSHVLHDIKAGEEILDNYLAFVGSEDDWEEDIRSLRNQCTGKSIGDVLEYEQAWTNE